MSTFDVVDSLMKKKGKKQVELCRYLGVGKNQYTDWKRGRIKSWRKYTPQIAEFLGVSSDKILGRDVAVYSAADFTEHERDLIYAYRAMPDLQAAVDKLLDISDDCCGYSAAHTVSAVVKEDGVTLTDEYGERLESQPETDMTLL